MIKKNVHNHNNIRTIIAQNKHAHYEYFIEHEIKAGLVLLGWEVKSSRARKVNISNSYVNFTNGEAYLLNAVFQPLIKASSHIINDPTRARKLLLNRHELHIIMNKINNKGYTAIAILLYWDYNLIKIKIGIAKGKKLYDKRANIKKRDWQRTKSRTIKYINHGKLL